MEVERAGRAREGTGDSIAGPVLNLLKNASKPPPLRLSTERRIAFMSEALEYVKHRRSLLNDNETIPGFGNTREKGDAAIQEVEDWITKTKGLVNMNTTEELVAFMEKAWDHSGHMHLIVPSHTKTGRRVRKAFRHAAMLRLWEIAANVHGDRDAAPTYISLEDKVRALEQRLQALEYIPCDRSCDC